MENIENLTKLTYNIINEGDYMETRKSLTRDFSIAKEARKIFIKEMNIKAKKIGMIDTNIVNASGMISKNQFSTSKDLLKMGVNAIEYNELIKIWNKKSYNLKISGTNERELPINTTVKNKALDNHYDIFGGKTGTLSKLNIKNLLIVVNSSDTDLLVGVIAEAQGNRFRAAKKLFDIATTMYSNKIVSEEQEINANKAAVTILPQAKSLVSENRGMPILYGKHEKEIIHHPASTLKIITTMVMLDNVDNLDEEIELVESDLKRGSGPKFQVGDIITFKDALYAMMLPSSNTAAHAVARVAGSRILNNL